MRYCVPIQFAFWPDVNHAKAETPVLWPPHAKSWLVGKDSDAGRDWGREEKGTTEDEMAGWHRWLDGRESGWTPGVGDGQGGLACCDSWGCKELDTTERLNWTEDYSLGRKEPDTTEQLNWTEGYSFNRGNKTYFVYMQMECFLSGHMVVYAYTYNKHVNTRYM